MILDIITEFLIDYFPGGGRRRSKEGSDEVKYFQGGVLSATPDTFPRTFKRILPATQAEKDLVALLLHCEGSLSKEVILELKARDNFFVSSEYRKKLEESLDLKSLRQQGGNSPLFPELYRITLPKYGTKTRHLYVCITDRTRFRRAYCEKII